jgi:hypothetical protein
VTVCFSRRAELQNLVSCGISYADCIKINFLMKPRYHYCYANTIMAQQRPKQRTIFVRLNTRGLVCKQRSCSCQRSFLESVFLLINFENFTPEFVQRRVVTPCSLIDANQNLKETSCLCLQCAKSVWLFRQVSACR